MRLYAILAVCLLAAWLSTTSALAEDGAAKPVLYTWLLEDCPAAPITTKRSALAEMAVGAAVSFVVDELASALNKAAEKDRNGEATTGANAGYLYLHEPEKAANPKQNISGRAAQAYPQRCIAAAITASPPSKWCSDTGPFERNSDFCRRTQLFDDAKHTPLSALLGGSELPKFYIEILLQESADLRAVLPQVCALYYPEGIHKSRKFRSSKPRDVHVKLSAMSPTGEAAMGTVAVCRASRQLGQNS